MSAPNERPDPAEVGLTLRTVLTAIADGEFEATDTERAYIAGAADALDKITPEPGLR